MTEAESRAAYERWWNDLNPLGVVQHVTMQIGGQWCCTVKFDNEAVDRIWVGSTYFPKGPRVGDRVRLLNPERLLYRL